jgi:hypothetical protein
MDEASRACNAATPPATAPEPGTAAIKLVEIMAVLGCAKATASRLRAGDYSAASELAQRYAALAALAQRLGRERQGADGPGAICRACPREDCSGCRIAELIGER